MRRLALVLVVACGRRGFDPVVDASVSHVHVAPGWSVAVLADFSGAVPYRPNDYQDGTNETLDNAPTAVAALYPPFAAELAVAAGRSIVELPSLAVHDYRPAVPDTTGPDAIYRISFGNPPDTGAALWIAAASQGAGDGLYYVSPSWQLTRDNANNNTTGVDFDATGAFDGIGTPTIYFADGTGVRRRGSASSNVLVYASINDLDGIAATATAQLVVHTPNGATTSDVDRVLATTHAAQIVATATRFALAEGGALASTSAAVIRDGITLAVYANDGTFVDGASSTDPAWVWVNAAAPQPPHRLAGSYVVLESNRTLDRDELLVVTPP